MLDFFQICTKEARGGIVEVYPDFTVGRSKDLMVQGSSFYAIWDEEKGLWSRDEYDVQRLVDAEVMKYAEKMKADGFQCSPKLLRSYSTNGWNQFRKFMKNVSDNSHPLDGKMTFANTKVTKTDYASRRLSYNLAPGDISTYEELISLLYEPEERDKFEWGIGAIIDGAAKKIQKFLVFHGDPGTGKSTVMDIVYMLVGGLVEEGGYGAMFDAKSLVGNNSAFSTESFKNNPLVAIQHDGDLSKIEDNSKLNSITSHEVLRVNEKYKATYDTKINAMLFMGTNKPVRITDAKSGLIRRLIDVHPTGKRHEVNRYYTLMERIPTELGAIAQHCLDKYRTLGRSHYSGYVPERMLKSTNPFYNYIEDHYDIFNAQDGTTLQQAWKLFNAWAEEVKLGYSMKQYIFGDELRNYFDEFHDRTTLNGEVKRKVYKGFKAKKFKAVVDDTTPKTYSLVLEETTSVLDDMYAGIPAQYAGRALTPAKYWDKSERISKKTGEPFIPTDDQVCSTVLGDLDTSRLHYVKLPEHHIWLDFDLTDEDGSKSLEKNLEAAASWKPTYAEISKSGSGVHLHYIYDGDTSELAAEVSPGIEIKVCRGNASLRRKLTKCNDVSVTTISGGLPFKEKTDTMQDVKTLKSERGLRDLITRALRKEIGNGATKPSIDFIKKVLDDAHKSGMVYDVSDMKGKILPFAINSSNNRDYCVKVVTQMKWKSEETSEEVTPERTPTTDGRVVFFDCEVYKNLFVICWKYEGDDSSPIRMINPAPMDVEKLLYQFKLVGFNNRSYDNHILYARYLGASNEELYRLSQRIMAKDDSAKFGEAWNLSYADVYDFSSDKKSLKKWEIELGIKHMEMDIPWDQPVPDDRILDVVEYCCNDVVALEEVWKACAGDFTARQLLAEMSGLTVNQSTRQHVMRILFGNEKRPQGKFVYTDLSEMFPGYEFDEFAKVNKSTYLGENVGEGGLVYAEPGIYKNVALLDVASMHPTSIIELNIFGEYTEHYTRIYEARLALKHAVEFWKDAEKFPEKALQLNASAEEMLQQARDLLPGIVVTRENAKALSDALKLVLNSTYGYTCAKFANPARDPRNKYNIVAKRGALFMMNLKKAVQEKGFTVAHIKTDSIKIPDATPEIIKFVQDFGAEYGYTFEHEATYEKMCLVNDAVYVAKYDYEKGDGNWTATGAEFKHPFIFKTLFTGDPISFRDLCETKQVKKGAMVLRFAEGDIEIGGEMDETLQIPDAPDTHIGRSGLFVPINPDQDIFKGGHLLCINGEKVSAVSGTKGYLWAEAEMIRVLQDGAIDRLTFERLEDAVQGTGSIADVIDMRYYTSLAESAYQSIAEFGDPELFITGKSLEDLIREPLNA